MTDHIIKAAQEAGFRTGKFVLSDSEIKPIPFIAPVSATDCQHEVARLYAIAFRQGMERAAEICDRFQARDVGMQPAECAGAIRAEAHAQNQPKTTHDGSVV